LFCRDATRRHATGVEDTTAASTFAGVMLCSHPPWIASAFPRLRRITEPGWPSTPQELADMLDKEDKLVVPMIKKLGIKAE
jgi:hypothetical protein